MTKAKPYRFKKEWLKNRNVPTREELHKAQAVSDKLKCPVCRKGFDGHGGWVPVKIEEANESQWKTGRVWACGMCQTEAFGMQVW